jgi:hypothetical protein
MAMDFFTSWIDGVAESIKNDQVTLAVLLGITYFGYKWVSKIDEANREDHARLGEKVDDLKDDISNAFQNHLDFWHNGQFEKPQRKKSAKKAAKKK